MQAKTTWNIFAATKLRKLRNSELGKHNPLQTLCVTTFEHSPLHYDYQILHLKCASRVEHRQCPHTATYHRSSISSPAFSPVYSSLPLMEIRSPPDEPPSSHDPSQQLETPALCHSHTPIDDHNNKFNSTDVTQPDSLQVIISQKESNTHQEIL